jgi:UDP-3-O-[3-hydroxymyristoyl] glucosamine N-acyltransferase
LLRPWSIFAASGTAGAHVHASARLESDVIVDPGIVIGPRAEIGTGTVIAANAVIGPGVRIGRQCSIGSRSSIQHSLIGDRVIIHAVSRLGQDGFGYVLGRSHAKVPRSVASRRPRITTQNPLCWAAMAKRTHE